MADPEPDDEAKQKERFFGLLDEYFARAEPDPAHIKDAKETNATTTDGAGAAGSDAAGGSGGRSGATAGGDASGSGAGEPGGGAKPKASAKAQGEGEPFDLIGFLVGKPKPKPS